MAALAAAAQRVEGQLVEHDLGRLRAVPRRAHDVRLCAAVAEELLDGVADLAVGRQPAEQPLEVGKAEDLLRAVVDARVGVPDEGADRRRDADDRVDRTG